MFGVGVVLSCEVFMVGLVGVSLAGSRCHVSRMVIGSATCSRSTESMPPCRVAADSSHGNRIITKFPVESGL